MFHQPASWMDPLRKPPEIPTDPQTPKAHGWGDLLHHRTAHAADAGGSTQGRGGRVGGRRGGGSDLLGAWQVREATTGGVLSHGSKNG